MMAGDLELGNHAADDGSIKNEKGGELDEYSNLVRYISEYRDPHANKVEEEEEPKKKGFFSKKSKKGPLGAFDAPAEWLETDMTAGLTTAEADARRKKTGWNELSADKENLFLKFIGFFKGPVLYSTLPPRHWLPS